MKKADIKLVLARWLILLTSLLAALVILLLRARPVIIAYAQSKAKAQMISAFDGAVKSAITELGYGYNDISVIVRDSGNSVCSIEIDYQKLNLLRAEISRQIGEYLAENENRTVEIPIGTLLGGEYLSGCGPALKFKMQYSHVPVLNFESKFTSAGINSIFHQIVINANLSCGVLVPGANNTFSVDLSAVAAQTVISGKVPDSFTNVIETSASNVADDIFNFSD